MDESKEWNWKAEVIQMTAEAIFKAIEAASIRPEMPAVFPIHAKSGRYEVQVHRVGD